MGKIISKETPLIGIEPSAIYTFKDEYLKLCEDKAAAKTLAFNCFAIEEFLSSEVELGNITQSSFNEEQHVLKNSRALLSKSTWESSRYF